MNFVQPIRDAYLLEEIKDYLLRSSDKYGVRNRMMFVFGINSGLRIQDILKLRVRDVQGDHIIMIEMKTRKKKFLKITPVLKRELKQYTEGRAGNEFLFQSRQGYNRPISREMAYKILRKAASEFDLVDIGTHTMRKTWAYHLYQKTKDLTLVQKMLNHSSDDYTLRYIGMDQDRMDAAMDNFGL
ncbi:site-specific integrase [Paenibacillus sp. ACRRX]|uniref:site-specific integrase n=1 Tax=Paenibacillus sp. ACRRX TaxID=2918206 RepID=UPI001EF5455B|nr:site-specific integrase [Paenibacillus sp. ACRRX]MCG7410587.1 site-specific integrase [Paenibacillus sp. ACRRX]